MRWLPILLLTLLLVSSLPVSTGSPDLAANPDTRHLWPMKEGSGTTVEDIVGTQDGTLTGHGVEDPPDWGFATGGAFKYLSWANTDGGSVSAGPAPQWTTGDEVSVIVWAKQTVKPSGSRIFGLADTTKTGVPVLSMDVGHTSGDFRWIARGQDGSLREVLCTHSFDDGNWHLYIGEISGSATNLFINDSLCGNTSGPDMRIDFSDLTWELGARSIDTGVDNFYKGDMAGFAVVDGLLSSAEKTEVFNNGPPLGLNATEPNPSTSLRSHWDFDEGSGLVAEDNVGDNNATMQDGDISWITGVQGLGWDLPGTDHGDYGSGVNLHSLTRNFTISFWLNGTEEDFFSGPVLDIGSRGSSTDADNYGLQASFTVDGTFRATIQTGLASGYNGESRGRWNTEMTVGDGWNHFVITSTSTEANAYHYACDGTISTNNITGDFGETLSWQDRRHRIGGLDPSLADDNPTESVGRFDEIRIYNAALSAAEVQTQFEEDFHTNLCTVGEPAPEPGLPDGWTSPVGTDNIFNFPTNATPRGVALTTNPRISEWSIMTGYLTENDEGVIDLLKTGDQGANIESSNFRVNAGDIEVGGMAQGPDLYKGCFQEEATGGSRVMFYITKDGSSFQVLNAATHGTQPLHCDVATPRDEAGREDWTGVVYGDSFTKSSWFVMDNKGTLQTPRVELPGSRQTGTDMVIRIKDADLTTYVSSTITAGSRLDPILGAGVHWKALADLNDLINIRPFHHVIETEGHETLANALINSNLNHADSAVSSVNNVMIVWADDLNNEIKFIETDPRGTATIIRDPLELKQGNITSPSADVTWIQIEPTGQGTYSGAYSDTDGNLVYFETNNNGGTWNTTTIANDVPTAQLENIQKFDLSYDRINESIVLTWTTETGIRIAFKPLTSGTALIDVERDWDTKPIEEKFREPNTFIGVNLQDQGDSTGIGLFGVKMLIIAAFTGLTIMFTYLFTFNAIMALGAGGSMSILLLVVWGVMPLWVLIFLVFFCAYIIVNHFTKRNNAGGETE